MKLAFVIQSFTTFMTYANTPKGKLSSFTVSVLKHICTFFELPVTSKDTKVILISKVKQMISECPCSA